MTLTAAGPIGRWLAGRVHTDRLCGLCLQASVGLGVISLAFLAIGAIRAIYAWVAWALLLAVLAVFRRQALGWLRGWGEIGLPWRGVLAVCRSVVSSCSIPL